LPTGHATLAPLGGGLIGPGVLWPQAYGTTPWNASLKDKLENRLHKEMCAGHITLKEARHDGERLARRVQEVLRGAAVGTRSAM